MPRARTHAETPCATLSRASQIFKKLMQDQYYRNGFHEEKLQIIKKLVEIKDELQRFASEPHRKRHEINGFFVECCARFSAQLPKNTGKAQEYAEMILAYLRQKNLYSPDYIWLKICGKRITITGIGEVKSHVQDIRHKPHQMSRQEQDIYNLVRTDCIHSILPVTHHVVLAEELMRYVILPRSINIPDLLPPSIPLEWEIKEIEFTFPEILCLKSLLLPDISEEEDVPFETFACSPELYKLCVDEIVMRTRHVILDLFSDLSLIYDIRNQYALMSWSLLTNSIPASHESIIRAIRWINEAQQNTTDILAFLSTPPESLMELNEKDVASLNTLITRITESDVPTAHAFLSRIRELNAKLPSFPELHDKIDIDLFSIL